MVRKVKMEHIDNRATTSGQQQPIENQISLPVEMKSELIKSLSRSIGLLCGQIIDDEERGNLIENINRIIIQLTDFVSFESEALNMRDELLNNLIVNKTQILTFDKLTKQNKTQLNAVNHELLVKIMDIKSENLIENDETGDSATNHDEGDQSNMNIKRMKKLTNEISDDRNSDVQAGQLNNQGIDMINELKQKIESIEQINHKIQHETKELNSKIKNQTDQMDDRLKGIDDEIEVLKQSKNFLKDQVYCLNLNDPNFKFSAYVLDCEFKLDQLLSRNLQNSPAFVRKGLYWKVEASNHMIDETDYLKLSILSEDRFNIYQSIRAQFIFNLQAPKKSSFRGHKTDLLMLSKTQSSHDLPKFIEVSELIKPNSVYVKNGSFRLKIHIIIDQTIENSKP